MSDRRPGVAALTFALLISAPAFAQHAKQNALPLGSSAATTAIPGDQPLPPPQQFGGKIERDSNHQARRNNSANGSLTIVWREGNGPLCVSDTS